MSQSLNIIELSSSVGWLIPNFPTKSSASSGSVSATRKSPSNKARKVWLGMVGTPIFSIISRCKYLN